MKKKLIFAPPANRGPSGQQEGGGRRGELLHLAEDASRRPTGREREETEGKSKENQSERDGGQVNYCVRQLQVREGKEGGPKRHT